MPGKLVGDRVIIRDQPEANRIYNKGGHGRPMSGGGLDLDLVEAAYLLAAGRLKIAPPYHDVAAFLSAATAARPDFTVEFLAFRELREQRPDLHLATRALRDLGVHFRTRAAKDSKPPVFVRAVSERTPAALADLFALATRAQEGDAQAIMAVVDEESEVTQYLLTLPDPRGHLRRDREADAVDAVLLRDRVFVQGSDAAGRLHRSEFFGKPVAGGYLLSLVEALHLANRRQLRLVDAQGEAVRPAQLRTQAEAVEAGLALRLAAYEDLKRRDLAVKTGYKFGTHFRAYEAEPTTTHAPYLVEAVEPGRVFEWPLLSRAIRLAHGVRKRLVLASVATRSVQLLGIERLR